MDYFHYIGDELYCEEVPVREVAEEVGTPFYLYSYRTIERHYKTFDNAFSGIRHLTCYSAKANTNIAILRIFVNLGAGVDIVSGGELYKALIAGFDPGKIVFSGVGKSDDEIDYGLREGILMFNVESPAELEVINERAYILNRKARISLRVNPDIDPMTHPYISTGLRKNKFGISFKEALKVYERASGLRNIEVCGIDCHIGSQLTSLSPFVDSLRRLKELIWELKKKGIHIKYLDLGGGLGIRYNDENPPHPDEYASAIIKEIDDMDLTIILEPGRIIMGNSGILITKVLYTKENEGKFFIIVDAAMNDLIRPSLYGSYHRIQPVVEKERDKIVADVVGPVCESGDFFAREREIPRMERGELLAIMSAGAYGFSMSSNYNSRRKVAEILVYGNRFFVIRKRETYRDLVENEIIPDVLR